MISTIEFLRLMGGPRSIAVVSPHPDDAALSCGGLLLSLPPIEMTLLTVFGRSRWMLGIDASDAPADLVTALRSKEDRAYAERLGANLVRLDAQDSSLRGYDSVTECGDGPLDRSAIELVQGLLAEALNRIRPDCVLGPAAIGQHVDHRLVSAGLTHLSRRCPWSLILFEDLPYAALQTGSTARPGSSDPGVIVSIDAAMDRKLEMLRIYRSQIEESTLSSLARHSARSAKGSFVERFWVEKIRGQA